jgi:hypothetical protein
MFTRRSPKKVVVSSVAVLGLLAAACSSSAATGYPGAGNPGGGAGATSLASALNQVLSANGGGGSHEFTATLQVTGSVTQSANFTETLSVLPPCSTLAKTGFGGTWSIPQPNTGSVKLNWNVTPYTGPGTFATKSQFKGSVELDTATDQYSTVPATVLSITVNADGSGSATFQKLKDGYGGVVSGSETWTCS